MTKYILPFLTAFSLTVILIVIGFLLAKRFKWSGRRSARHIHRSGVYRIGGIAMTLVFIVSVILDRNLIVSQELNAMMIGLLVLMIVGIKDDVREIHWKYQLFFQIAVSVFVFIMGIRIFYISEPFGNQIFDLASGIGALFSMLLVVFWIIFIVNSMNWLDGVDGLSGGVTLIAAVTIFFLSLKPEVNQPPVAILASILAGTALGFLIFNFYPSRIIAGTSGSLFMGFSLAALSVFSGTKIATAILVLAIPIIDLVWVIGERIRNKQSIFQPSRNHIHHKLLELGWSQRKIAIYCYLISGAMALVALNTRAIGKTVAFSIVLVIMLAVFLLINNRLRKRDA